MSHEYSKFVPTLATYSNRTDEDRWAMDLRLVQSCTGNRQHSKELRNKNDNINYLFHDNTDDASTV